MDDEVEGDIADDVMDAFDVAWIESFQRFMEYETDADGKRLVPTTYKSPDGYQLGKWQNRQRQAYKRGVLAPERIAKLEEAGIVWDTKHAAWEAGFARFSAVVPNAQGKRTVPQKLVLSDGYKLGSWLHTQRTTHAKGQLSAERVERLDSLGMLWETNVAAWEDGLYHFKMVPPNENGKRIVPPSFISDDGYNLGSWQNVQRQVYKKDNMPAERIKELEDLGMVWDPFEAAWEQGFQSFRKYPPSADGSRLIAQTYVDENGFKLGAWQAHQRQAFKKGQLTEERVAQLEAFGVVWDPFEVVWQESFQRFLEYPPDEDGKRRIPQAYKTKDGFRLGAWQTTQRTTYNRGLMSAERWQKLEKGGIVWQVREPTADRCKRTGRRQLQPTAETAAELPMDEMPVDELVWHAEWRERLSCWWLMLPGPTQANLGHCLGALSLHLGSRLDALLGRPAAAPAQAEPGCEWLEAEAERLQLPDFPYFGGFDFTLPPIPRLLPSLQQLQSHAHLPRDAPRASEGWVPAAVGGIGGGTAAFVLVGLVLGLSRRSASSRGGRR